MLEFTNPFSGIVPQRKLTDSELARALRLDLAAEAASEAFALEAGKPIPTVGDLEQ